MPLLILGHDHDAGTHAAHELGSFDLALAIAFAVGAIRPALSAGLAWPCAIAAAGLAGTAIADLIGGQTIGADEAQHLIAVAGAVLLFWQARTAGTGIADAGTRRDRLAPGRAPAPCRSRPPSRCGGDPPQSPGGAAGAARVTGPDVAARAGGTARTGQPTPAEGPDGTRTVAPDGRRRQGGGTRWPHGRGRVTLATATGPGPGRRADSREIEPRSSRG